jgi:hypothetical protein
MCCDGVVWRVCFLVVVCVCVCVCVYVFGTGGRAAGMAGWFDDKDIFRILSAYHCLGLVCACVRVCVCACVCV